MNLTIGECGYYIGYQGYESYDHKYEKHLTRGIQSRQMAARLPNLCAKFTLVATFIRFQGVEDREVQHFNLTLDLDCPQMSKAFFTQKN